MLLLGNVGSYIEGLTYSKAYTYSKAKGRGRVSSESIIDILI
jgi:hypothetical protein